MAITGSSYRSRPVRSRPTRAGSRHGEPLFCATTDDHRSEMILSTRSPGLVNEAWSIRWAQPLRNIPGLAAVIGNPCIDDAAASEGLHRARLHHRPMIHVILMAWTITILVCNSPDFGAPTLSIS